MAIPVPQSITDVPAPAAVGSAGPGVVSRVLRGALRTRRGKVGAALALFVLFGDLYVHGPDGLRFYTRGKVVTRRWADPSHRGVDLGFPVDG